MATLQNLIDAVDNLEDSVSDLSSQVNIRKANLDSAIASAQGSSSQAAASATQAATSATQAATSATQAVNAAGQATQVAMGQATGIAGIIPSARIRASSSFLAPEFTFTRGGSSATFFNRNLRLVAAPPNTARFDFDPLTGHALGLLVEAPKTNLVLRSNDLVTGGFWVVSGHTVSKTFSGLRGNNNEAWRITNDPSPSIISQLVSGLTPNTQYTFSFFARNNGGTNAYIGVRDEGTLVFTARNFGSEIVNSEFRRISISFTTGASTTSARVYLAAGGQTNVDWIFQDAQLEVGGLSSYIGETTNATVTRNEDNLTQVASTANPLEGTIILRVRRNVTTASTFIFLMNAGTSANQMEFTSQGRIRTLIDNVAYTIEAGASGAGVYDTYAISYTQNRIAVSRNGGAVQSVTIPSFWSTIQLVSLRNLDTNSSKHIHTYQYKRKALTDAELIVRSNPATFYGFENGDVALNADLGDAAFVNVNAIQRLPGRLDMPFFGTGSNQSYTFRLDFDCEVRDLFTTGSTFTRPTPGTTILRDTNITVTHNAPVGTVLILSFLPIIQ